MKKALFYLIILSTFIIGCQNSKAPQVINEGLQFCESVRTYKGGLLIANFGGSALNPLNTDGLGYITYWKNGKMSTLIHSDGYLSAPKGMAIKNHRLFIADVNKVVVYYLANLTKAPEVIPFPASETFVNDIVFSGNTMLVSVTNTGNIYSLDISNFDEINGSDLMWYSKVPGANGLLLVDSMLYIASYPTDGETKVENVIYSISNLLAPDPKPITARIGQYDGLAISKNKKKLYFTSWESGKVGFINLEDDSIHFLSIPEVLRGPAEIDILNDMLCVPDLVNSCVWLLPINRETKE
ncbi:MAG: hypothetical protein ACRCY6_02985 [Bacteroidales bacterium]